MFSFSLFFLNLFPPPLFLGCSKNITQQCFWLRLPQSRLSVHRLLHADNLCEISNSDVWMYQRQLHLLIHFIWPIYNLYPTPEDRDNRNYTPGSTHGHQSWTAAATQMGRPWDTLGFDPLTSYRADRWALGGRWGVESGLTGGVGKRCGAGAMRWNSWHSRKVRTFADSARNSEWTRQLRVRCARAFLAF